MEANHKRCVRALMAAGWSNERIAVHLQVSESTVRKWLTTNTPRPRVMAKLVRLVERMEAGR
jgi:DNA-binding NarL/FixJ family response regulator